MSYGVAGAGAGNVPYPVAGASNVPYPVAGASNVPYPVAGVSHHCVPKVGGAFSNVGYILVLFILLVIVLRTCFW